MTLDEAVIGDTMIVKELKNNGSIRRRLLDLGIMKNTRIQPVLCSSSHHMRAYFVKGTLIALREGESKAILVEKEVGELV